MNRTTHPVLSLILSPFSSPGPSSPSQYSGVPSSHPSQMRAEERGGGRRDGEGGGGGMGREEGGGGEREEGGREGRKEEGKGGGREGGGRRIVGRG